MKTCSRCKRNKDLTEFRPDKRFKLGRRPECRKCAKPQRLKESERYRATQNGRDKRREGQRRYFNDPVGREARRETARKQRVRLKKAALFYYSGGKPLCACCGEEEEKFLSIDHIHGGGRQHRETVCKGQGGTQFYRWLLRANYPAGFQVLCFNCNFAKSAFGVCPHQQEG